MKFRTDFVTNSSSSSYGSVTVGLANGEKITMDYDDDTAHAVASIRIHDAGKSIFSIKSVTELADLLTADEGEMDEYGIAEEMFEKFIEGLLTKVKDIKDIAYVDVSHCESRYGEFCRDDEIEEGMGASGRTNRYDFVKHEITYGEEEIFL